MRRELACPLLAVFLVQYVATDEVCYKRLGCFSMESPWLSPLRPLPPPEDPREIDTRFYLYTREMPGRYSVRTWPQISLEGSHFHGDRRTFFICHGYLSTGNFSWVDDMKNALLRKVDCNVFIVDWGKGSFDPNYLQVASNIRVVAAEMSRLGSHLTAKFKADLADFHVIGHSLGSHIAGYMGKNLPGIGRITALDPAQPVFEGYDPMVRLAKGDALFIDAIHTNGRPMVPPFIGLGYVTAIGDVDFFMNGGWGQPGCVAQLFQLNILSLNDFTSFPVEQLEDTIACDHLRAIEYFTETLTNPDCIFWGHSESSIQRALGVLTRGQISRFLPHDLCTLDSCTPMGLATVSFPARGSFTVTTKATIPFCIAEINEDENMMDALSRYRESLQLKRNALQPEDGTHVLPAHIGKFKSDIF